MGVAGSGLVLSLRQLPTVETQAAIVWGHKQGSQTREHMLGRTVFSRRSNSHET